MSDRATVVDTMVFAYALLGVSEFREESLEVLTSAKKIAVPDSFRAEITNVVWQWVRYRSLDLAQGLDTLETTESLLSLVAPASALWRQALVLATEHDHSVYDTLFVALADQLDTTVVTYDEALLRKFPSRTVSASVFLSSS